jgi:hypothetical protein
MIQMQLCNVTKNPLKLQFGEPFPGNPFCHVIYKLASAETRKVACQDWLFAMTSSSANLVWFLHLEKPKNPKTEKKKSRKVFHFF